MWVKCLVLLKVCDACWLFTYAAVQPQWAVLYVVLICATACIQCLKSDSTLLLACNYLKYFKIKIIHHNPNSMSKEKALQTNSPFSHFTGKWAFVSVVTGVVIISDLCKDCRTPSRGRASLPEPGVPSHLSTCTHLQYDSPVREEETPT